ncbi:MAG: prolipoprotein diacylglyceryl transferase [Bdellovibrionota bacterium]
MHPILFEIFGRPVHTYGLTAATGFLLGFFYARWQARQTNQDEEQAADLCFYAIIFGVLGSRILYVAINWPYFSEHLLDIVRIDKGGLVFYGGPVFTAIPLWYVIWKRKLSVMAYSDIIMPATILGLGMGRLGCLAAGCCYGRPATVPWAITYPVGSSPDEAYGGLPVHPTPLYEFAACLFIVGVAVWWNQRKKVHGETFFLTIILYAVLRSTIEFFRGDSVRGFAIEGVLSTSQLISLLVGVAAVVAWLRIRAHPLPTMSLDYQPPGR